VGFFRFQEMKLKSGLECMTKMSCIWCGFCLWLTWFPDVFNK